MKRTFLALFCLFLACSTFVLAEDDYPSLELINATDWTGWFDKTLGYLYDSHGCLHFTPTDIYLLYKTIPAGIPLTVKKYKLKEGEPPYPLAKIPYLSEKIKSQDDIKKVNLTFKNYKTELVMYPSLNQLVIMVKGYPYAKVYALVAMHTSAVRSRSVCHMSLDRRVRATACSDTTVKAVHARWVGS